MPHLIVKLAQGRDHAIKQELADRLTSAIIDVLGVDASAVSVTVEEVPAQDWMQQVYGPDIEARAERLLKRPGYGPLAAPPESEA